MTKPKLSDVNEISDNEFKEKVDEIEKTRDPEYGRDGTIDVWRKTYEYKGIEYDIALLRYFKTGMPISEIKGMNQYGKWFVLEYPTNSKAQLINKKFDEDDYEFLYKDTLHAGDTTKSFEQLFDSMVIAAKEDIDNFIDTFESRINDKIKEFNELKYEFNELLLN